MVNYSVTVHTSDRAYSNTSDYIYMTLVGTDGESERTQLPVSMFCGVGSSPFDMSCPSAIGELKLIKLEKNGFVTEDSWFPDKVVVKSPENKTFTFPIYRWINDSNVYEFKEGAALTYHKDAKDNGLITRKKELKEREKAYRWYIYKEGLPHCIEADDPSQLPPEVTFSFTKEIGLAVYAFTGWINSNGLYCTERWSTMDDITNTFNTRKTDIADHVRKNWKEDDFFGYQFLNGVNPMMIRCCYSLPENFPVPDNVLHCRDFLADEMKNGNIYLCDYKILDGIPTNVINEKEQYLMAPLVLLHKTTENKMKPIAIQLKQKPAEDNPIFFPTDSEYDWLLAKIFVRSADFNVHQLNSHLLRTHLLAEVFAMSLLRNVPMVHPLYKLLVPHTRYTFHINALARTLLISPDGVFSQFAASGGEREGQVEILRRSLSSLTYTSLCIPDDIAERGLEDVQNFYYRDDGLKLWGIIHKFVNGVLSCYYKADFHVGNDHELQKWISDIFKYGFLSLKSTGIPEKLTSVSELTKFVTMVIFTGSAQHAAVNSGQYDYGAWMPNTPITLQLPPPTKKGEATEETMMKTFPDINATVKGMETQYLLSHRSCDFVPLGQFPDEHFTEEEPLKKIKEFQRDLKELSNVIKARNKTLTVPYEYLDPEKVENSVAI